MILTTLFKIKSYSFSSPTGLALVHVARTRRTGGEGRIFLCFSFCSANIWGTLPLIFFFPEPSSILWNSNYFKGWFQLKIQTKSLHCYFFVWILQSCSIVLRFFLSPVNLFYVHNVFFNNLLEKNSWWKAIELQFYDKTEDRWKPEYEHQMLMNIPISRLTLLKKIRFSYKLFTSLSIITTWSSVPLRTSFPSQWRYLTTKRNWNKQ